MSNNYDSLLQALMKATRSENINKNQNILGLGAQAVQQSSLNFLIQSNFSFKKENLYFRNKQIDIDGYEFINCRFDNCKFSTEKGTFKFKNCVFDESTLVSYSGAALKILKLYNRRVQIKSANLSPEINADGTITIQ